MSTAPARRPRVLVIGEDTRAFLSVVRSLGRYGLEVHVAGCPMNAPALSSRYVSRVHRLPAYLVGDTSWMEAITELMRVEEFDLVIPCHDSAIVPLQHHRERLEGKGLVFLLEPGAFAATTDKLRTFELATELGVPVPRSRVVRSAGELFEAGRDLGFPLVVKPRSSFELGALHQRKTVKVARARRDLEGIDWSNEGTRLAQEYVRGRGAGVEALCLDGRILVALQHQRLHEPLQGGGSSYRRTVPLQPHLAQAAERLLLALKYTGVAMVEFRVDAETGAWTLMEINGRFWGSLPLSVAAGVDFPRYLYELLCCGRTEFPREYRLNVYARNWLADFHWLRSNLRADRSDPFLLTVPNAQVVKELANLLMGREASDTLALDDPRPALAEVVHVLRAYLAPRLRRSKLVRLRLAARARRALRGASRVLFVCKGNICRSPFGAALVNEEGHVKGLMARSAGSIPLRGRSTPELAVRAAEGFGVDLSVHRSSELGQSLSEWADIVFIFDRAQEEFIRAAAPELLKKTHYLGALDRDGALEIADPFGGDINGFREVYARIAAILRPVCRR